MKAILVTDPDWSSRTTSDWSDCADRNIWDDLYDMMSAIQEKWKTLEEMLKEIAEITDCSKIESLARLWEAEEVKEATKNSLRNIHCFFAVAADREKFGAGCG